jgi:Protein of unknown function (DUF2390)
MNSRFSDIDDGLGIVASAWSILLKSSFDPIHWRLGSPVGDVCLDLQDRFGADVGIGPYGLWQAHGGRRSSDIREVIELVGIWQKNVVWPLRMGKAFPEGPAAGVAIARH